MFTSKATKWGCEHEKIAIETYTNQHHSGFIVSCSGLVVHTSYPHIGASPDGSDDCGTGLQCPFLCKHKTFLEAASMSYFHPKIETWSSNSERLNFYFKANNIKYDDKTSVQN